MIFSDAAICDLEDIEDFLAGESREAAHRTIDVLLERIRVLERVPEAGRKRPEVAAGIRSWPLMSYVVFYRIENEAVEIVRILHGSRDVATELSP